MKIAAIVLLIITTLFLFAVIDNRANHALALKALNDKHIEQVEVMKRKHWIVTRKAVADECGATQNFVDEYLKKEVC